MKTGTNIDYNKQYIASQMKDLRKGKPIYIYNTARKLEIEEYIKLEELKVNIEVTNRTDKYRTHEIDYWTYVRCFRWQLKCLLNLFQ